MCRPAEFGGLRNGGMVRSGGRLRCSLGVMEEGRALPLRLNIIRRFELVTSFREEKLLTGQDSVLYLNVIFCLVILRHTSLHPIPSFSLSLNCFLTFKSPFVVCATWKGIGY